MKKIILYLLCIDDVATLDTSMPNDAIVNVSVDCDYQPVELFTNGTRENWGPVEHYFVFW